jgi:hypothetical protein
MYRKSSLSQKEKLDSSESLGRLEYSEPDSGFNPKTYSFHYIEHPHETKIKPKSDKKLDETVDNIDEPDPGLLEYKEFSSRFSKIELAGFKGEDKITQLQEKSTHKIF